MDVRTNPISEFQQRFIESCELNCQLRKLELHGQSDSDPGLLSRRQQALESLLALYLGAADRSIVATAITDPYFPLTMLRKLNVVELAREPRFVELTDERLGEIMSEQLLKWAEMFLSIRRDVTRLNTDAHVSNLKLTGSPQEVLPDGGWCNYCGGCCEIRGGPPEFTGPFSPPDYWLVYFHGDGCDHQRFCPFLFEYFASGKYFCAIYKVKPTCCWEFGQEECEFLQEDLGRKNAAFTQA